MMDVASSSSSDSEGDGAGSPGPTPMKMAFTQTDKSFVASKYGRGHGRWDALKLVAATLVGLVVVTVTSGDVFARSKGVLGYVLTVALLIITSENRNLLNFNTIGKGLLTQFIIAYFTFRTTLGVTIVSYISTFISWFLDNGLGFTMINGIQPILIFLRRVAGDIETSSRERVHRLLTMATVLISGAAVLWLTPGFTVDKLVQATLIGIPAAMVFAHVRMPESEFATRIVRERNEREETCMQFIYTEAKYSIKVLFIMLGTTFAMMGLSFFIVEYLPSLLVPSTTLYHIISYLFYPFAYLLGTPPAEITTISHIIGQKFLIHETFAFTELAVLKENGVVSERMAEVVFYAISGLSNWIALVAVMVSGWMFVGKERRGFVPGVAVSSVFTGAVVSFSTACLAAVLV